MEIKIDSIISFEKIKNDVEEVFKLVDKNEKVVLLKDNQPAYIITKYDASSGIGVGCLQNGYSNLKLQEAMKLVLLETDNHTMHASELADEIYNRRLYLQKNGGKAKYNQIRARCDHYPDMFEALAGNYIKLKEYEE